MSYKIKKFGLSKPSFSVTDKVSLNESSTLIKEKTENSNLNEDEDEEEVPNFIPELKELMYGFGDNEKPDNETVTLLQEYVIEYIQNLSLEAYKRSKRKGFNEIVLKDLLYVLKNDKKRFYRAPTLIKFYEKMKEANTKIKASDKKMAKYAEK